MIIDACKNIPEKERVTLVRVANRITDIANNLLKGYKKPNVDNDKAKQQKILVYLALSNIVSEKRGQYINSSTVIEGDYGPGCEFLFIKANLLNFERMISNLINNSFEAIENKKGEINLNLSQEGEYIKITITDNGRGMPQDVIDKIMNNIVVTSNKKSGYGIGFAQVREAINISNGKMEIKSTIGKGTEINLFFPIVDAPGWIAKQISLPEGSVVVIIDDDPSIHDAWNLRFKKYLEKIHIKNFDQGEKAIDFINSFPEKNNIFLLVDFELIEQNLTGLKIIEQTAMTKQATLVTSHHNRPDVLKAVSESKIKILPKQLAPSIPIKIKTKKTGKKTRENYRKVDLVVIDDDEMFAESFAVFFRSRSFTVDAYYNPNKFLKKLLQYDKSTSIFIDNNLCSNITGIELAEELHKDGYNNLYLLSGTDFKKDKVPDYLTVIIKSDMDTLNELRKKWSCK
jgi:FixJ family two-component response regulator